MLVLLMKKFAFDTYNFSIRIDLVCYNSLPLHSYLCAFGIWPKESILGQFNQTFIRFVLILLQRPIAIRSMKKFMKFLHHFQASSYCFPLMKCLWRIATLNSYFINSGCLSTSVHMNFSHLNFSNWKGHNYWSAF